MGGHNSFPGLSLSIAMRDRAARLHIVISSAAFPQLPLAEIKPVAQHEAQGLGDAAAGVARQFLESQLLCGRQGYGAHRFHSSIAKKQGQTPYFSFGLRMQRLFAAPPIARTPPLMSHRKNHERIGFPTVDERI